MMDHGAKAEELFRQGYNCAQAVAVAFCDVTGLEPDFAARMASSFGGGLGRQREVCGAVSGMLMAAGLLYGYDTPGDENAKRAHYIRVQALCAEFRAQAGSIVCRDILNDPPSDPNPTPRTAEFYRTRPCAGLIALAGRILDAYMASHPIPNR